LGPRLALAGLRTQTERLRQQRRAEPGQQAQQTAPQPATAPVAQIDQL
jgi:hypothetical protein